MLYQGKYRVESARKPNWDYSGQGSYHVTIVTANRTPWFGEIKNNEMHLSVEGFIVAKEWLKTPFIRPYVELDEWVVMPEHIHGIVHIDPEKLDSSKLADGEVLLPKIDRNQPKSRLIAKSLGSMVGQIKGACTKEITERINPDFAWQARFHDVIIDDDRQLENTRRYIRQNIAKWSQSAP